MNVIMRIIITSVVAFALSYILNGISIDSFWTAIILAIILGILNAIVRPLLVIVTFPITLITFGLFLLVINAIIVLLAEKILPGFQVRSFWWALLFGLLLSFFQSLFYREKKE